MAQAHKVHLRVVTAEAQVLEEEADLVIAPGGGGELGIQARHIPIVSTLKPGLLRVQNEGDERDLVITGGFFEVRNEDEGSAMIVLADAAERAEEIDLARAQAARERAEQRLSESQQHVDSARAQAALLRAIARIQASERYRSRHQTGR